MVWGCLPHCTGKSRRGQRQNAYSLRLTGNALPLAKGQAFETSKAGNPSMEVPAHPFSEFLCHPEYSLLLWSPWAEVVSSSLEHPFLQDQGARRAALTWAAATRHPTLFCWHRQTSSGARPGSLWLASLAGFAPHVWEQLTHPADHTVRHKGQRTSVGRAWPLSKLLAEKRAAAVLSTFWS